MLARMLLAVVLSALLLIYTKTPAPQLNNSDTGTEAKVLAVVQPVQATANEVTTDTTQEPSPQLTKVSEPEFVGCEAYKQQLELYDWDIDIATAVMRAESGCNPSATNTANIDGSVDRGLFQVNSVHRAKVASLDDLYDPSINIQIAYRVYQGNGWSAWSAYNSGSYRKFL